MSKFSFKVLYQDKKTRARLGEIKTPHGIINTPVFVPVGTQATVKSLTPHELETLGTELFFVNTYHAYLRPGLEVIKKFGGLHNFMGWDKPLITDSGGFQVFSLGRNKKFGKKAGNQAVKLGHDPEEDAASLVKINDDGVEFRSHWDGSLHIFTPESSIQTQHILGADLIIAFDECAPFPSTHEYAVAAMERTHRWALRSLAEHKKLNNQQALYGVVQGSIYEDLRYESADFIANQDFDGIAIGGVSVGESKEDMRKVCDWVLPRLPKAKPRHLLGVGEIDDIFEIIERGVDTFDCVQPTRLARMGRLLINQLTNLTNKFEIDITKEEFAEDVDPIDGKCICYTCQHFSRAYLHHLFRVRELLAYRLATIHNLYFMHRLVSDIRKAISENRLLDLKKEWL